MYPVEDSLPVLWRRKRTPPGWDPSEDEDGVETVRRVRVPGTTLSELGSGSSTVRRS